MRNNLRKYRGINNMTLDELGKKIGVSRACISYMELHSLNIDCAVKIAEVLNVNVFELLGSDALRLLPLTEEDKENLIKTIRGL